MFRLQTHGKRYEQNSQQIPQLGKVVFVYILLPGNQQLIKFNGIADIPTQVLLNKNSKEFSRHTGYYSSEVISKKIIQK